jgi:hypothetical protein
MSLRLLMLAAATAALCYAAPAHADPCEGLLPSRAGIQFSGVVRYVGDGDGLCVGPTADPNEWIEIRLADFSAPELNAPDGLAAKATLERLALRREVVCTSERGRGGRVRSFDRVIARCRIGGTSLGDLLRQARVAEGGN